MTDPMVSEPVAKRADQLVVGDRILARQLPAAATEPGAVEFVKLYTYVKHPWVFVAFQLPNGLIEAAHYLVDAQLLVYPADPTGQLYSRADDGETTQPIAGRTPPHYGEVIDVDLVVEGGRSATPLAGGLVEIDPPEGFVPASAPVAKVFACVAHGVHPHPGSGGELMVCLDCPQCRPPGSTV